MPTMSDKPLKKKRAKRGTAFSRNDYWNEPQLFEIVKNLQDTSLVLRPSERKLLERTLYTAILALSRAIINKYDPQKTSFTVDERHYDLSSHAYIKLLEKYNPNSGSKVFSYTTRIVINKYLDWKHHESSEKNLIYKTSTTEITPSGRYRSKILQQHIQPDIDIDKQL